MLLKPRDTFVFMGDSVTDVGRARPQGEGARDDCEGRGYPALLAALVRARRPELNLRFINMGVSGDTSRDLAARWESDAMALEPNWVSILIGVNDVWRQFDQMQWKDERQVYPREYAKNLDGLIAKTKPRVDGVLLLTPFFMEPNRQDAMRARVDEYAGICRELAAKHGVRLVDTQAVFDRLLQHMYSAYLSWDRVHPNLTGHMAIADAMYQTLLDVH